MAPDDDNTRTYVPLTGGTMVSHYRIIEKIGAGGMGEVYLAEDTVLNRKVALKFLPLHMCQDADCRARFKREAQAAAKLDHPNIVAVFEVGEFQGRPFFSMQHVEGQTLREVLAGKTMPLDRILEIGIQVCEGLQAAHENGITHRDIKPSNILIDSHGRARIVDFGLASVLGSDHLTKTGSTLGTVGYMSPEQVRGEQVDHRTDLFSFGVVLYEMITGHPPFKADSEAATLHAITSTTPELLARFRREVSSELQAIVDKALEKNVATRYQHADDIEADLKRITAAAVKPQTPRRDSWNRYVVTSAVAILLIIVGYWAVSNYFPSMSQKPEPSRKMLAVLPFENLGSTEDEYFADGITDEITGKLATVRELGVISRTSTMQYKKTTKNLKQIAKELSVDYILEGTIRWDKDGDTSRVRILPQLIRVSDDTHLWAETYQRPMTDIFAVQADVAGKIVEAMNITLLGAEQTTLGTMPTQNLEAYQAYLRGMVYFQRAEWNRRECQTGIELLQHAVALDSTFALAYTWLAMSHARMYHAGFDRTPDRLHHAKTALDRALVLQPDLGWAHIAKSYYYLWGFRDYDRALDELTIAETSLPNEGQIAELRSYIWRRQGKFQAAIQQLKQAFLSSPLNANLAHEIGWTYDILRDFEQADKFLALSISLRPDLVDAYVSRAWICYQWRADTSSARSILSAIPDQDDDDTRVAWAYQYLFERDYPATLEQLAHLPSVADRMLSDFTPRALLEGVVYRLLGDSERAQTAFNSARVILENELEARPEDHRVHGSLGIAYAGLGRREDAIREGRLGVELFPVSKDAYFGPYRVQDLVHIYLMVGEYDSALDQIEYLLSIPADFSIGELSLDPRFDPLRDHPRYQKLVEKYGT